jgi:membrane associated rhomboid family serine protease
MIFILPVGVDYRARRYPVVTFVLMDICILVYLVTLGFEMSGNREDVDSWVYENLWLIPDESHWWTYVTSIFVHGGFFHLLGNMIYLFLFGACVEDKIGRIRFTLFYLLGGVVAGFAYIALSPDHFASEIPMGGASGAISACIGAFMVLMAHSKIEFKWLVFFMLRIWNGEFTLPAWVVISFWFLKDLALMFLAQSMETHGGGVAFGAHVGGTLFGVGLGALEKMRLKRAGDGEFEEMEEKPAVIVSNRAVRVAVKPKSTPAAAEMPTIYLHWAGTQFGPFTSEQIHQKFAAGQIPADALYAQEGMTDWRPADELRQPGTY